MATDLSYIEYVVEQIEGTGNLRYRKMFGEYMIYVNDKPLLLVCDNTVYVKMLEQVKGLLSDADTGFPYQGAKEHYILNVDDKDLSKHVINVLEPIIPIPKKRKSTK